MKNRRLISKAKRRRVTERYSGRCGICGATPSKPTMDHIVPFSKGGTDEELNLQPACFRCNVEKGDRCGFIDAEG